MSGLKSLAALIGGIGVGLSGYAKGQAQFQQNQRQKTLDARDDEQYERTRVKQDKADKLESDLAASQADQVAQAVPSYDITSMGGGDPAKQPTIGYQAGGQFYTDKAQADQQLVGMNSRAEKARRAADIYSSAGQFDKAAAMQKLMDEHIKEGTDQALARIQQGAPQLAELDKNGGRMLSTVGKDVADLYNGIGGRFKVSENTAVEYFKDKNAAGQEFVNARVLGKDGKPVVDDVNGAMQMFLSAKERLAARQDEARTHLQSVQIAEAGRHNKAVEDESRENNRAARANAAAQLGIQQQRLNMEAKSFKKQTLAGQIEEIETATGVKLTPEEKKQFAGVGKKGNAKNDNALMDKIVEKSVELYQTNNPNATAGQVAAYTTKLQSDLAGARTNLQVDAALQTELGGLKPDSPAYATKWAQAKALGLTDQQLVAKGYAAPKGGSMVPNPTGQGAASGVIPPAPKERVWVGNQYQVNPAYTEWQQRYGDIVRRQESATQSRLISAYERAPK